MPINQGFFGIINFFHIKHYIKHLRASQTAHSFLMGNLSYFPENVIYHAGYTSKSMDATGAGIYDICFRQGKKARYNIIL